jgi:site-specific DNA-methyltransferase (adenine-specific)
MAQIHGTLDDLTVDIDSVQPHPDNVREGDIGAIVSSLKHHGQYRPIVVSTRTRNICAGNHTWKAAKQLGWKRLAVTFVDVDADGERRILLVDNRSNDVASYDNQALTDLLVELTATVDGLAGTGYDGDDLDELMADLQGDTRGNDGVVSDPPVDPITELGDVWLLGPHRLVCGDCTDPNQWQLDGKFDLLWTDPPYGVSYADKNVWLNELDRRTVGGGGNRIEKEIAADSQTPEEMQTFWTAALTAALLFADDKAAYYVTGPSGELMHRLMSAIKDSGWQLKHMLIWAKDNSTLGRSDYHYQHEPVLYGWNKTHTWYGDRSQHSLLEHARPTVNDLHPTMKPISLIEQCIVNSTKAGDLVADPFAGSGSTLIAAGNLNRSCYAMEIDPAYCDVIVKRWETATGDTATREVT